ncbi:hypothetical protein LAZ67_5004299, partial [Cordylochernes scorpioides]
MNLRKILADDLKWRAVGRMEAGQSQVEVAKWLNVNKSVVRKIWKQFIETGTIKRKEGSGRKIKTAISEDRYLVVTAKRHREMTAIQLSNELSSATGTIISRQTVYRRLHEGALYARRPMVCIPLTSAHRRARLNWCLEHRAWTHDQWANVLFSDESRFSLNIDSQRVFIWREPGTRYHPSNIREIDSFRGGSLLVWAGISSSRRTPLHIFSGGTLTAQRYRDEILEPYLRPYRDQIGHNLILMDDNARPHRARLVNEYLQSENIRRMDWPARSPDLNPIEHVWDALGRRIGARHPSPRTLVELRTALLEEWGLLPLDLLQSLVNSMRARCETLIAVRGRQRSTKGNNRTGGQNNCQNGCRSTGIHLISIQRVTGTQVSKMTINRRLRERNLRARRPLRCLPLTPVHRQVRLQWCRERSTWNCADWGRIVFSDESRFLLCPDDRRKRVWRRPGQRVDPGLTVEHHTGLQKGVMVWGAISFNSRTPLVVIPVTLTAKRGPEDYDIMAFEDKVNATEMLDDNPQEVPPQVTQFLLDVFDQDHDTDDDSDLPNDGMLGLFEV